MVTCELFSLLFSSGQDARPTGLSRDTFSRNHKTLVCAVSPHVYRAERQPTSSVCGRNTRAYMGGRSQHAKINQSMLSAVQLSLSATSPLLVPIDADSGIYVSFAKPSMIVRREVRRL